MSEVALYPRVSHADSAFAMPQPSFHTLHFPTDSEAIPLDGVL